MEGSHKHKKMELAKELRNPATGERPLLVLNLAQKIKKTNCLSAYGFAKGVFAEHTECEFAPKDTRNLPQKRSVQFFRAQVVSLR